MRIGESEIRGGLIRIVQSPETDHVVIRRDDLAVIWIECDRGYPSAHPGNRIAQLAICFAGSDFAVCMAAHRHILHTPELDMPTVWSTAAGGEQASSAVE